MFDFFRLHSVRSPESLKSVLKKKKARAFWHGKDESLHRAGKQNSGEDYTEGALVSLSDYFRSKLKDWRWEEKEWERRTMEAFEYLSCLLLRIKWDWSFQRLVPPPSLFLLWAEIQGSGRSSVRQGSPPCSTWGSEGTWWVSSPLCSITWWDVGDTEAHLPLCPQEGLLFCEESRSARYLQGSPGPISCLFTKPVTQKVQLRKQSLKGHPLEILIFLFLCGISIYPDATLPLY